MTAILALAALPSTGLAFSIINVTVLPDTPLTPSTNVQLFTAITTPNQDAMLYEPTAVEQAGNALTIDIFITDGMTLPATDLLEETVDFGMLAMGEYSYVVRITAGYFVDFGVREAEGRFTVVPLPAALWLLASAMGLLGLARNKIRGQIYFLEK